MSISEAERYEIYELIKQASNDRVANNIMSLLPPVGWADVATKTDVRAEIARLDCRIDVLRSDLVGEMHQSIRNQTWALVAWTTGLAGLIIALTR